MNVPKHEHFKCTDIFIHMINICCFLMWCWLWERMCVFWGLGFGGGGGWLSHTPATSVVKSSVQSRRETSLFCHRLVNDFACLSCVKINK